MVLQMVISESGYKQMLEASADAFDQERLENLKELIGDIKEFSAAAPEATLEDYLQMVALYTDIQNDNGGQYVQLMTVHAAKGLEFDNVFVIGLSDGIFPSDKAMNEGIKGLEEERRLAYVAFTRARQRLYLTESRGYNYATNCSKVPSRFLSEIDSAYLDNRGVNTAGSASKTIDRSLAQAAGFVPVKNNTDYKPGDQVHHDDFGDGVLISIDGSFGTIAFAYPYRTKTIALGFPKLHKKEID
jgi:DNA helicase-2/ATP-dependent DNA helicase PcrA